MNRRNFLIKIASSAAALSLFNIKARAASTQTKMFIGTPVLPEYLYENGIAKTLDQMQDRAGINTVMTFSHDHVFNQYNRNFTPKVAHDGQPLTNTWVKTNLKYYPNPDWAKRDANKYSDRDVLDDLWAEAEPRGMQVYARILEPYVITGAIPGFEPFAEIDANGNEGRNACFNHPGYMSYWDAVVEDLIRSHPYLHGFKFGQERGGPILSSMGKNNPGTCFCEHCVPQAKERGIDVEKAKKGLVAIQDYGNRINAGWKPVNGNFVEFLKILIAYPDVLSWEQFWMDSREAQRKRIYKLIKSIRPEVQVGWHICHGMTWDLITRATWDYAKMGPYSDWLSIAVYFDSMGRRSMGHYDRNYRKILFGDADEKYSYPMYLSMLGYDPKVEAQLEAHRDHDTSFSAEYVYQECKRAVTAVNGEADMYARPGFDMPGYDCNVTEEEVYKATTRALDAGVDGLWCGREWDELKPENAGAFGRAIKEYKHS